MSDPFPQGTPQSSTPQPPPTPSADLAVVEAEIVEEGEEPYSPLHDQVQRLTDEIRSIRPNWSALDLKTHLTAALAQFDGNIAVVAELARRTARDPTSARPSRITASGNPHVRDANTAMVLARVDSLPDVSWTPRHPSAHLFVPGADSGGCQRCQLPQGNERHRV